VTTNRDHVTEVVPIQTYIPEDLATALRERAKANERSVAAEVRLILREAVDTAEEAA
jgi:plasmid stability protein